MGAGELSVQPVVDHSPLLAKSFWTQGLGILPAPSPCVRSCPQLALIISAGLPDRSSSDQLGARCWPRSQAEPAAPPIIHRRLPPGPRSRVPPTPPSPLG